MLIFNNLGGALSVKSCYSRFLNSAAVFLLVGILAATLFVKEEESPNIYAKATTISYAKN